MDDLLMDENHTAAHDLLSAYSANTALLHDADDGPAGWAHDAFRAAPAAVPDGGRPDTPMLRWSNPDVPALPLLEAMLNPPAHRSASCDRCAKPHPHGHAVHRLWLPGGQTAVELQVCPMCRSVLDAVYRSGSDDGPLLVWRP